MKNSEEASESWRSCKSTQQPLTTVLLESEYIMCYLNFRFSMEIPNTAQMLFYFFTIYVFIAVV